MKTKNFTFAISLLAAIILCATNVCAEPVNNNPWSIGYRVLLLNADGKPVNDMVGSGVFLRYQISKEYRVEGSLEYLEYDFESPQRYLGFSRTTTEEVDSRTRSTQISIRVERSWEASNRYLHPFVFAGLGLGYTEINDFSGATADGSFDVSADGGIETVPGCGIGVRYHHDRWMVDGGLRIERHIASWELEDRMSGTFAEVGDYTAWGGWIGLSVYL